MYKTADETKPDFSLSGVWLQKDVDTNYASKVSQMNQEESIYGFIANTKAIQINSNDVNAIQKYVGADASVRPQIDNPTNLNRIILKIINNTQHEPIKANITYNLVDKKIEIKVTYTANGISKIIDEYGNTMTLTEENGKIQTDTGSTGLAKGTYYFTVIDNKGNKRELSIAPNVDSLFKVAYISGTDNMDNTATYNKTQETISSAETTLLNQIKATDTTKTFDRAIQDNNKAITAIGREGRTNEDEQMYIYNRYKKEVIGKEWRNSGSPTNYQGAETPKSGKTYYGFKKFSINPDSGVITLSDCEEVKCDGKSFYLPTGTVMTSYKYSATVTGYVYFVDAHRTFGFRVFKSISTQVDKYGKGDFISYVVESDGKYPNGESFGSYWYVRNSLAPKYTLYKYDQDLTLKSTYDIDTKTLTTEPVDISNKGRNKVKLTLNMYSSNYKVYISNDNTNWQGVTEITSSIPKELDVDGWDKLYVKVETNIGVTTNTTRVNNIDIAYYKG